MRRAIIRADASATIGGGHVMRCLALASALVDAGCRSSFVMGAADAAFERRILEQGHDVRRLRGLPALGSPDDLEQTRAVARENRAEIGIVDGYHFGEAYQRGLREAVSGLVQVDDLAEAVGVADVVINHGLQADEARYRSRMRPGARVLLGPRYALLRTEFREARRQSAPRSRPVRHLLISMGAGDPDDVTGRVIGWLAGSRVAPSRITAVVGPAYPHLGALRRAAAGDPRVELRVDEARMPDVMLEADLALSAGGGTVLELLCLGVPLLTAPIAANQVPIARRLAELNVGVDLGLARELTPGRLLAAIEHLAADQAGRESMSRRGMGLVDGEGAVRAARAVLESMGAGNREGVQ